MRGRHTALSLIVGTASVLVLAGSGVAWAADGTVEGSFAGTVSGPVGLAAVAFGVVGLVTGLIRRRKSLPVSAQNQRVVPPVVDVPPVAPVTTQV